MRLRAVASSLANDFPNAQEVVKALENVNVKTTFDLLFAEDGPDALFSQLPRGLLPYADFLKLRDVLALRSATEGESGLRIYEQEALTSKTQEGGESGVPEVDELLHDAFGSFDVIEISGAASNQLILWILLRYLAEHSEASALWIDASGDFPSHSANAALRHLSSMAGSDTALERLQVSLCFDLPAVHNALDALRRALDTLSNDASKPSSVRFLVISPLNPLFAQHFSGSSSQGHALLTTFMRQLSSIARIYRLTVLVHNSFVASQPTNPWSAFASTITKPGLGPTFTYLCDHTVWIAAADVLFGEDDETLKAIRESSGPSAQVYIAEVFRTRNSTSRTWAPFLIRDSAAMESVKWEPKDGVLKWTR